MKNECDDKTVVSGNRVREVYLEVKKKGGTNGQMRPTAKRANVNQ